MDFPALKTITGSLRVDYEPAGADVLLNGNKVGVTPLVLKELPVGDYQLEIWKEYYVKEFATVRITEDQEWKESGKLKLTYFGNIALPEGGKWIDNEVPNDNWPIPLIQYYRYGAAEGYRGEVYTCEKDTFVVPFNPTKAIYWLKNIAKEKHESYESDWIKEELGPLYPSVSDDAQLSFAWAKKRVEEAEKEEWSHHSSQRGVYLQQYGYAALAWHYFYGIGCEKNIEEAKTLIRWECTKEGEYIFPSLIELIKDMGLDSELKYVPIQLHK